MKLDNGALSFTQAADEFARIDTLATAGSLDLSAVAQVDSAGVALLLEIARRARQRGLAIELRNPPEQLRGLVTFFGVAGMLGIPTGDAAA
ncbi:STAS domain-containing protein [Fontimonas sp. SYSU GA230001]|uniref:STAS domain-containing protein n=1 Tax=Fontimonas sp. SYSU GA230001 TaxID=3142450 RepID=UPI0032B4A592